jgi:DNA-binding NarL/FixJ family response regulator
MLVVGCVPVRRAGSELSSVNEPGAAGITIGVEGADVFNQAGVEALVKQEPEIRILPGAQIPRADVVVFVTSRLNGKILQYLRLARRKYQGRFVLILDELGDGDWVAAAEVGVAGVIWRSVISPRSFTAVVRAVAVGDALMPPEVQSRLLEDVVQLQNAVLVPRGLSAPGLDAREIDMLRLIAEGLSTAEIAQRMQYSERGVKKILYEMMSRLKLRNRSHAVAFAMRSGIL